jgi:uncharacterized alpha-E superfamily protein
VNVVDFLLRSDVFPRSLAFCIQQVQRSLAEISHSSEECVSTDAEILTTEVRDELCRLTAAEILESGLHQFVDRFQTRLNSIGQAVSERFFELSAPVNTQ